MAFNIASHACFAVEDTSSTYYSSFLRRCMCKNCENYPTGCDATSIYPTTCKNGGNVTTIISTSSEERKGISSGSKTRCSCPKFFGGRCCEHHICLGEDSGFSSLHNQCNCEVGRSGKHCEILRDETEVGPCEVGKSNAYLNGKCFCKKHFHGKRCEVRCVHGTYTGWFSADTSLSSCNPCCICDLSWKGSECDTLIRKPYDTDLTYNADWGSSQNQNSDYYNSGGSSDDCRGVFCGGDSKQMAIAVPAVLIILFLLSWYVKHRSKQLPTQSQSAGYAQTSNGYDAQRQTSSLPGHPTHLNGTRRGWPQPLRGGTSASHSRTPVRQGRRPPPTTRYVTTGRAAHAADSNVAVSSTSSPNTRRYTSFASCAGSTEAARLRSQGTSSSGNNGTGPPGSSALDFPDRPPPSYDETVVKDRDDDDEPDDPLPPSYSTLMLDSV